MNRAARIKIPPSAAASGSVMSHAAKIPAMVFHFACRVTAPMPNSAPQETCVVDNGQPTFVTYVALGVAGRETPTGTYSTWGKYRADDMTSASVRDPGGYYDLPNVPNTQYYLDGGFAIHGTYWHNAFGRPMSHGCVNLPTDEAQWFFDFASVGTPVRVV